MSEPNFPHRRHRSRRPAALRRHDDQWAAARRAYVANMVDVLPPTDDLAMLGLSIARDEWIADAAQQLLDAVADGSDREWSPERIETIRRHLEAGVVVRGVDLRAAMLAEVRRADPHSLIVRIVLDTLSRRIHPRGRLLLPVPAVVTELGELLGLEPTEQRILTFLFLTDDSNAGQNALREVSHNEALAVAAQMCGVSVAEFTRLTSEGSRLASLGLFDTRGSAGYRDELLDMSLSRPLLFSFRANSLAELSAGLFEPPRAAAYPVASFALPSIEVETLTAVLGSGRSVLLAGEPGVGKTEFAHAIAAHLGRTARMLAPRRSAYATGMHTASTTERLLLVRFAAAWIDRTREILVVDEADALLQGATGLLQLLGPAGGTFDKAELNALLEDLDIPVIWITNDVEGIPASAMRRFGHVTAFPRPSVAMRERLLTETLGAAGVALPPDRARDLARRYELTPAAIDRMARVLAADPDRRTDAEAIARHAETYIHAASHGPTGRDFRRLFAPSRSFDPRFCHTTTPLDAVERFVRSRLDRSAGARLLFDGPPGGGKTQYALYLSLQVEREAIVRRPSDLIAPWVGETEARIARAFAEAEQRGAVLILDEADALLAARAGAMRSYELRWAAEFLQQIGEYQGTLIACTNRVESVDPALRRRFQRRVTFGALTDELLVDALAHIFPRVEFSAEDRRILESGPALMMSDLATAAELVEDAEAEADRIVAEILTSARSRDMTREVGF